MILMTGAVCWLCVLGFLRDVRQPPPDRVDSTLRRNNLLWDPRDSDDVKAEYLERDMTRNRCECSGGARDWLRIDCRVERFHERSQER